MQLVAHRGRPPFTSTELMVEFVVVLIMVHELVSLCACDSECVAVDDGLVFITMSYVRALHKIFLPNLVMIF